MLSKFRLFTFVRRNVYFANRAEFHDPYPRKTKINGLVLKEAPEIRILNVAEKNDDAKRIVSFLSRGTERMVSNFFFFVLNVQNMPMMLLFL